MRSDPRTGGFVLLEVLIALVIFASVVLAWSTATDNALIAASEANADRTIRMLASRKWAEIRARPYEYRDGGEGGFEEELDAGEENPFLDYRWQVEAQEVVAAGYDGGDDAVHLFDRDEEGGEPTVKEGEAAPKPVKLLRLTLTVSHVPEGSDESQSMRVVAFVKSQDEEEEGQGPGGGGR